MKKRFLMLFVLLAIFVPLVVSAGHGNAKQPASDSIAAAAIQPDHQAFQGGQDWEHPFRVFSTTFQRDGQIPASMVFNGTLGSTCTGGNESPELSWTHAGRGTRSYAVALFDVSANFTHWGVYNIPAETTELPAGAGAPGGTEQQVYNDAGIQGYTGPCPPPGSETDTNGIHQYVFTVYALDQKLDLIPSPDFPPSADALYRAMINHVIDQASITGFFSCKDASSCS
jgi:Raf kinase inhibitor-like YbhB/YbcL family protein